MSELSIDLPLLTRGQAYLNLDLANIGKCGKVPYAVDMIVVEMSLESVASAKLLAAASDHLLTSPGIRLGIRWEVIILCVLHRNPTANPLSRSLETGVSTDMALEIWRTVVALHPFAVGTGPRVALRYWGSRYDSQGRLGIARERGMTRSLAWCSSLLRRANSGTGTGSSRSVPFFGAQSG